jgi:hypothetical protein
VVASHGLVSTTSWIATAKLTEGSLERTLNRAILTAWLLRARIARFGTSRSVTGDTLRLGLSGAGWWATVGVRLCSFGPATRAVC